MLIGVDVKMQNVTMTAASRVTSAFGMTIAALSVMLLDTDALNVAIVMSEVSLDGGMNSGMSSTQMLDYGSVSEITSSIVGINGNLQNSAIRLINVTHVSVIDGGYVSSLVVVSSNVTLSAPMVYMFVVPAIIGSSPNFVYTNVTLEIHNASLKSNFNTTIVRSPKSLASVDFWNLGRLSVSPFNHCQLH